MRTLALILCALGAAPASASPPAPPRPLHSYDGLALSPSGRVIAAIEGEAEPDARVGHHAAIVLRSAVSGAIVDRIDPCATCGYAGLAFGSGDRLAFVMRGPQAGHASLMIADGKGRAHPIGEVDGTVTMLRWSPDGSRIAALVTIGARKEVGATQAGIRQVGEIGASDDIQRIAIVPVAGGTLSPVSPADRYVYEYDWTPDGRGFVATTALGNGDAHWWVATLDAIDAATGRVRAIARPATQMPKMQMPAMQMPAMQMPAMQMPAMQMNAPRVSPDGRTVAFIGGLMSDFGSVGGDVWSVPLAGGTPRNLTPGYRGSFTSLSWPRGGLIATALIDDRAAIVPVGPAGPQPPVWSAPVSIAAGDARIAVDAGGGTIATVAQDHAHPPAILAGAIAAPRAVTHDNDGYPAIVTARSIHWRGDGGPVQGWLLLPAGAAGKTAPTTAPKMAMLTIVHGGPSAASTPGFVWQGVAAALVGRGYALFYPNPRGSYGQGEAFTAANRRDFGGGDLRDILAGIDAVEAAAPIDEARLGLMGGSYGGFMAMWANTQTDRFKAIEASAGLSNWISYYGTNGINSWMIPFFGAAMYDDPAAYAKVSPIGSVRRAHTPTLIAVGERDIEVPPTQSVEWWNGLKANGVATTLMIYPDEGHAIRDPDHAADLRRRTIAWFDRYLGGR